MSQTDGEKPTAEYVGGAELADLFDRATNAGWDCGGVDKVNLSEKWYGTTGIVLVRQEGGISPDPESYARIFEMTDERGILHHGLVVEEDEGRLHIEYYGANGDRLRDFMENAIAAGSFLNTVQALKNRYSPEYLVEILKNLPAMLDPELQESIREMDAGELTDITPMV